MLLSDVCLSVAYIGPNLRTERPMKINIGTEVAHVIRVSRHHFQGQKVKGQGSRSPGRFTHRSLIARGRCSGDRENVLGVGNCYVASARRRARRCGAHGGGGEGRGHIVSPPRAPKTLVTPLLKTLYNKTRNLKEILKRGKWVFFGKPLYFSPFQAF